MTTNRTRDLDERDANEDPITGEPGAHPVGAGLGAAAGGAAAGAAAGIVAGPVGTVAGAVIGGVAGGLAGKAIAEGIDPTTEEQYWRDEYPSANTTMRLSVMRMLLPHIDMGGNLGSNIRNGTGMRLNLN